MTSRDHRLYMEMLEGDIHRFLSLGGVQDAVVLGFQLGHMLFDDVEPEERAALNAARDAAVARISQAIEEAE